MDEQYFSSDPTSKRDMREFTAELVGHRFRFRTDAGVFSKDDVDVGTRLLTEELPCRPGDVVLDLGCGYGPLGAAAAVLVGENGKVYLVDVNPRAVSLARENMERNGLGQTQVLLSHGLEALSGVQFDWVVTNPPIRAGKAVVRKLLADAFDCLKPGGSLLLVIRTKQGAKSMEQYLRSQLGPTETVRKQSGFRVLAVRKLPAEG